MLERDDLIEKMNDLMHLDMDAVKAYDEAIEKIENQMQRSTLSQYRDDHMRHVTNLQRMVSDMGGTPEEARPDFKGMFIEGMTSLRSAMGDEQALKAMRQNEMLTNRRYKDAAGWDTGAEVHSMLMKNYEDEQRHLAWIEQQLSVTAGTRSQY